MSRYVVRFMKDVLGENGREIEVCQSSLEIDASDAGEATEMAKRKFCESQALLRLVAACRPDPDQGGRFSVLKLVVIKAKSGTDTFVSPKAGSVDLSTRRCRH